jgi:hypothetical protein
MVKGDDADDGTWNKCFGNKGGRIRFRTKLSFTVSVEVTITDDSNGSAPRLIYLIKGRGFTGEQ